MDLSGIALLIIAAALVYFFVLKRKEKDTAQPTQPEPIPSPKPTPVENIPPEVFPPFLAGDLDWRGMFTIDLRHRLHGCDSTGLPIDESGSYDPDGELLRYHIQVKGPDGKGGTAEYSVFDRDGKRIDGKWLSKDHFPVVRKNRFDANDMTMEQEAVVYCFVGHSEDQPPGGFLVTAKSCPKPPAPIPSPAPAVIGEMTVMYKASDLAGRTRSAATKATVTVTGCGGG